MKRKQLDDLPSVDEHYPLISVNETEEQMRAIAKRHQWQRGSQGVFSRRMLRVFAWLDEERSKRKERAS